MIRVQLTDRYLTGLKRLHKQMPELDEEIDKRISWFVKKPNDERLENHPLTGKLTGFSAFSITKSIRIMYLWLNDDHARFLAIGTHDEVYKL